MSSGYHHRHMSSGGGPIGQSTSSSRTAELFRSDLITAMKLPDSHYIDSSNYVEIRDQWRSEWEVGVQVCVSPQSIPQSSVRQSSLEEVREEQKFAIPDELFSDEVNSQLTQDEVLLKGTYEIDELDQAWLQLVNEKRKYKILAGSNGISEKLLKSSIMTLEKKCYYNMIKALATEESLRIEYDQSIVCDVCKDPEREEANEMIFCDSCNVCVHQACYGVQLIPKGSWLCRPCTSQQSHPFHCQLCPNKNGAMKRVKPGSGWAHMSCALWIPEVKIANIDKMEPITNIDSIPASRWNLMCCLCRERNGACIQCSYPTCVSSYHVTCGYKNGLEMKAVLCKAGSTVKHESYCPRHTTLRKTPSKLLSPSNSKLATPNNLLAPPSLSPLVELTPLQRVESQFYEYTSHEELSKELKISSQASSLIYNYWKLKRKCNHNQPLLLGLHLDLSYQRLQLANNQSDRQVPLLTDDDDFLRIVHLRHNLEKARNLVYMIQRRERLKSISIRSDHEITRLQLKQAEEEEEEERLKAKKIKGGVVNNRKPLCLKRLGISSSSSDSVPPTQTTPTTHCFTNGPMLVLHPIDHTMANEESIRLLRKKRPHLISSPLSSHEHVAQRRRLSESGCGHGDIVNHDSTRREKSNKSILC